MGKKGKMKNDKAIKMNKPIVNIYVTFFHIRPHIFISPLIHHVYVTGLKYNMIRVIKKKMTH